LVVAAALELADLYALVWLGGEFGDEFGVMQTVAVGLNSAVVPFVGAAWALTAGAKALVDDGDFVDVVGRVLGDG